VFLFIVMLSVGVFNVIMLCVIMLNAIILSVVAPERRLYHKAGKEQVQNRSFYSTRILFATPYLLFYAIHVINHHLCLVFTKIS
jgi:hypothetical protein